VDGSPPDGFDLDSDETTKLQPKPKADLLAGALPPGWKIHPSEDGGFSVPLPPDASRPMQDKIQSKALGEITMKGLDVRTNDDLSFMIAYFELSPELKKQSPEGQLKALLTFYEKESGLRPEIKRKTPITLGKYSGFEVQATDDNGPTLMRFFVTPQRAYIQAVSGRNLAVNSQEVQAFIGMFKLK
jgi:hypothetical protein